MDMKRNGWIFIIVAVVVIPLVARIACTAMVSDEELTTTAAESTMESEEDATDAEGDESSDAVTETEKNGGESSATSEGSEAETTESSGVSATIIGQEMGTTIQAETTEKPTYGLPVEKPVEE